MIDLRDHSELGRHHGHPDHRATYYGLVTGYHAWDCECGATFFTETPPESEPKRSFVGRVSSATRLLT